MLVLFVVLLAAGGYLRFEQPKDWNKLLDSFKADLPVETPLPPIKPVKAQAEYITPNSTNFVNSPHIIDVQQPAHAASTNAPPVPSNKVFVPPNPLPAEAAWTWTTSDGQIFHNVIIEKVEADRVTIFHDKGSAVLDMYVLSNDVQRQLNYDPDLAAEALTTRQRAKGGGAHAGP